MSHTDSAGTRKLRIGVVGIGNCASSLLQAIEADRRQPLESGVRHPDIGGLRIRDLEIVSAFDVDERKIGRDVRDAALAPPNCTTSYVDVPERGVVVERGALRDGVAPHMESTFQVDRSAAWRSAAQIAEVLVRSATDVVIIYLPVGSTEAAHVYADAAVVAGCALVNCTPAPLATDPAVVRRFLLAGLPLLGDDIKSQVGSTVLHRAILEGLTRAGVTVTSSYQLNVGGNSDFLNMREPSRGTHKRKTKHASLEHLLDDGVPIGVGPSDHVPHLRDHKVGYIHVDGQALLGMPFSIEMRLAVEDSPNSAGIALDALRAAGAAKAAGLAGTLDSASAICFKNPPRRLTETSAERDFAQLLVSWDPARNSTMSGSAVAS
jgi:myo-inositol-1-phosphate synthase